MNEPSNFCNGECNQNNVKTLKEEIEKADYVNEDYLNSPIELEYTPGRGSLETNTICKKKLWYFYENNIFVNKHLIYFTLEITHTKMCIIFMDSLKPSTLIKHLKG